MSPRTAALALVGGGVAALAVAVALIASLLWGVVAGTACALLVGGVAAILVGLLMVDVDREPDEPTAGGEPRG